MKLFLESVPRSELLAYQTFLINHLPDYVDVKLKLDGVILTGNFDPIEISFKHVGTDNAEFLLNTTYEVSRQYSLPPNWTLSDFKLHDLKLILGILNTNVGIRKICNWLKSEGFKEPFPDKNKDLQWTFHFEKIVSPGVKARVSFSSNLDYDGSVIVAINNDNFWQADKTKFSPKTLMAVKHAVEQALEQWETTGDEHENLHLPRDHISHLELKRYK